MKDVAGNELSIGDMVAYAKTSNKNNVLEIGYVTAFTSKKITIASSPDGPTHKSLPRGSSHVESTFSALVAKIFFT